MYKLFSFTAAALAVSLLIGGAKAADWDKAFAQSDKTVCKKVWFYNRLGIQLAADMYLPKDAAASKLPAVVVGAPGGTVKEQSAGLYAQTLAEHGFAALAFDPSYQGESGGQPRGAVSPEARVEDFSAAADFLSSRPEADAAHIGVVGIGSGGAYAVSAAAVDPRLKAVVTVNLTDEGREYRQGLNDSRDKEELKEKFEKIAERRTAEYAGGEREFESNIPETIDGKSSEKDKDIFAYYGTERSRHPRASSSVDAAAGQALANFYPFAQIDLIAPRAVLFIVGEKAYSRYFSEDVFLTAEDPKELYSVPNAGHTDLYDNPKMIPFDVMAKFFENTLKPEEEKAPEIK